MSYDYKPVPQELVDFLAKEWERYVRRVYELRL
jgi:hypothetical protein